MLNHTGWFPQNFIASTECEHITALVVLVTKQFIRLLHGNLSALSYVIQSTCRHLAQLDACT